MNICMPSSGFHEEMREELKKVQDSIEKEKTLLNDNYLDFPDYSTFSGFLLEFLRLRGIKAFMSNTAPFSINILVSYIDVRLLYVKENTYFVFINEKRTNPLGTTRVLSMIHIVLDVYNNKRNDGNLVTLYLPGQYMCHTEDNQYLPTIRLRDLGMSCVTTRDKYRYFRVTKDLVSYFTGCRHVTLFNGSVTKKQNTD